MKNARAERKAARSTQHARMHLNNEAIMGKGRWSGASSMLEEESLESRGRERVL